MSETRITIEEVASVQDHPNADRLSVIRVLGYQVITGRDQFKVGDLVVYFPPDILIPCARELGVEKYMKHATYPGDSGKSQCRVAAARLRGVPSYGFVHRNQDEIIIANIGTDVTNHFKGIKYEPPVREGAGDAASEFGTFHRYTIIENIQRYPNLIEEGTPVIITEKIHGTNCRVGLCRANGELIYMAGSHKIPRKEGPGLYWSFMDDNMRQMLSHISDDFGCADVIIFGEIFGQGVQDLTYGQTGKSFRAFDISVNGTYLNHSEMESLCLEYGIPMVPVLHRGSFNHAVIEKHTHGDTTFVTSDKFTGREGIVIRPQTETIDHMGRRVILKSISADYLDRRGATNLE